MGLQLESAKTALRRRRLIAGIGASVVGVALLATAGVVVAWELGARDAEIEDLRARIGEVEATSSDLRAQLDAAIGDRAVRDAEIARLTHAMSDADGANAALAALDGKYASLLAEHEQLVARWSQLQPIDATDLSTVPLYLDRSLSNVVATRPLCTGSMEPNITCDDLLILYTPPSITDLDVGDIIYYKKPNPDCTGYIEDGFSLHRINRVIIRSDGLWFETKGDALANPDRCLVPADAVIFKLLTTVRNARIDEPVAQGAP